MRIMAPLGQVKVVASEGEAADADVAIMSGMWAFDRYGGRPNQETAQIRQNTSGDGFPDWIVIPPFRPMVVRDGKAEVREDFKPVSPAYFAVMESLRLTGEELGDSPSILLLLPLMGMDDPSDESTPISVAQAIDDFFGAGISE
jgi:hypothetical protein